MRDEWAFPTPVARLYRFVHRDDDPKWNAVRTPDGIGTLMQAFSCPKGCQVQLMQERETARGYGKNPPPVMRSYDHDEIQPARRKGA